MCSSDLTVSSLILYALATRPFDLFSIEWLLSGDTIFPIFMKIGKRLGKCRIKLYCTSAIQQHTAPQRSAVFFPDFVLLFVLLSQSFQTSKNKSSKYFACHRLFFLHACLQCVLQYRKKNRFGVILCIAPCIADFTTSFPGQRGYC